MSNSPLQQLTFAKILTQQSLFYEISAQIKQERKQLFIQQRQLFTMCQSNKDYQVWKDKFKNRILQRNIVTYFAMIQAFKSILTENQTQFQPSLLKTSNISNPYSHLLCFRLLKDSFLKVDYGLLTLIESQLSDLIFNVSIFDSMNQDEQRGRCLYLQGVTSQSFQKSLSMTHEELEVVGFSVHKIVLETLMTLGSGLSTLPYHPIQASKQELKPDQSGLTDRMLTPRTLNSTFTNDFQRQKMKSLSQSFKKYSPNTILSLSHGFYNKTKKMSIKYPEKLHYFKQKEIEKYIFILLKRFRKDVVFNSEQKQYHILKFYEFLIAFIIRQQIDFNQRLLQNIKTKNDQDFSKFRNEFFNEQRKSCKGILKNILRTKDRFCLYFTIIYFSNTLKMINFQQKNKQTFSQETKLTVFFSICQLLEYLTLDLKKSKDEREGVEYIELKNFSMEMFLAIDQILSQFLLNTYFVLFQGSKITSTFISEYVRHYFYCLLLKLEKVRLVLIASSQKHMRRQLNEAGLKQLLDDKQSLLRVLSQTLLKYYAKHRMPDHINHINVRNSEKRLLERFESVKNLSIVKLTDIEFTKIQITSNTVERINLEAELIENFNLISLAKSKCSLFQFNDDISVNQEDNNFLKEKLLENLKFHQTLNLINQNDYQQKLSSIDTVNLDNVRVQIRSGAILDIDVEKEKEQYGDDEIPKESATRPKSIETYRLKINPNDISKLNLNKTYSQSKQHTNHFQKSSLKTFQMERLLFKDTLEKGVSRLNLLNRDTQTLRNLSSRKYKRKCSNSREQILPLSSQRLDEALSCPTYMEQNSIESADFGQTYQQLPSQKKIMTNSKDMERILALEKEIQVSKKQQEKLMSKIKKQQETISSLLSKDDKKKPTLKATGFPLSEKYGQKLNIRDSISKQFHTISIQPQLTDGFHEGTSKTGNTQKRQLLDIKDTQSFDIQLYPTTPTHKTKNKSRFNESQQNSMPIQKAKFDSTERKHSSNGTSAFKNEMNLTDRLYLAKEYSNAESEQTSLQLFQFSHKIKKDLLKKKVLIMKDQLVEIGMITQFQKIIPSEKAFTSAKEVKNQNRYNHFKIKSSLYITPLTKLRRIELQVHDPLWLFHQFQTNKSKQNLKPDSQYISYVDFWLREVFDHKHMNTLPELEVKIEIENMNNQNQSTESKAYRFTLPLFVNKFFIEEALTKSEANQVYVMAGSDDSQIIQLSSKLVKQPKDLEKYFSRLFPSYKSSHTLDQIYLIKFSFLHQSTYLCFGTTFETQNSKIQTKDGSKGLNFKIFAGSEVNKSKSLDKESSSIEDLLITAIFSLLAD